MKKWSKFFIILMMVITISAIHLPNSNQIKLAGDVDVDDPHNEEPASPSISKA